VENFSQHQKNWFFCNKQQDEYLLAALEISQMRKAPIDFGEQITWKYILTTHHSSLIALNTENEIEDIFEISNKEMTVKTEIGKDPVSVGEYQWLCSRQNEKKYHDIKNCVPIEKYSRLYEIARLNWLTKIKNNQLFANDIFNFLTATRQDPIDEFTLFFINIENINNKDIINKFAEEDRLINIIKKILKNQESASALISWYEKWHFSLVTTVALIYILTRVPEDTNDFSKILPFHRKIRELFYKEEKDKINKIIFDINFCKHLIKCNENKEAIILLEDHLKNLPDETLLDLLPAHNLDITSTASGQTLKIKILDMLVLANEKDKSVINSLQLAMLQPLVRQRLEQLITNSSDNLKMRAEEIKHLLEIGGLLSEEDIYTDEIYNSLKRKDIEDRLRHPAMRNASTLNNFQTWIATVKIPDYSIIKSYAEPLNIKNYPELNNIISDIKIALELEKVEPFISRGDKSVGITSFEAEIPFIIIGGEHLNKDSQYHLTSNEFKFALGLELAHLFFKHSRITANDVWRGAMDKSIFLVDALLSILPVVGILGKSFSYFEKLSSFAGFLQKTEKITNITSKSQVILNSTGQAVNLYQKISKKETEMAREQEMLAISRLMQLTADRAGLLFCGNIKAAVRSMFLVSRNYASELHVIEKYGLEKFILKQDETGNFVNQEFSLRIANLFSFYLSDDYVTLKNEIKMK